MQEKVSKINLHGTGSIIKLFISLIASFIIVVALVFLNICNSFDVITIILFALFTFLIFKSAEFLNKRLLRYSLILGLIFSVLFVIGKYVHETYSVPSVGLRLGLQILGMLLLFSLCIAYFIQGVGFVRNWTRLKNKCFAPSKKFIILVWIIIFACWIPCFIASFPGVFAYDAPHQYWQFDTGQIANNQPVVSSAILFAIMNIGNAIFGSYEGGLAFFIVIQMLFGSFVLAYSCNLLNKLKVHAIIQIAIIAFLAIFPVNHLFAVNATKDTLHAFIFVFLIISIIELIMDTDRFISSPPLMIRFIILIMLQMFYKNNGVYVFIVAAVLILIMCRKNKKNLLKMAIVCLACLGSYFVVIGPVYSAAGIGSSKIVEMLAIPTQQMAAAYVNSSDKLSEEQIDTMMEIMPEGTVEEYKNLYHPRNSDFIRPNVDGDMFSQDPGKYLSNYLSIGKTASKDYINALLNQTLGYWYPNMNLPDENILPQTYIEYTNSNYLATVMTERYHLWPDLAYVYKRIAEEGVYQKIPVLSMFFSVGFVSWMLLLFFVTLLYYKRRLECIPIAIMFILWLTSFAGPLILLRYVYPLFLMLPIYFGVLFSDSFKKNTSDSDDVVS